MTVLRLSSIALAALATLAGCQHGCTGFGGDIDGVPFDPNGTVFTYIDATDDRDDPAEPARVAVAMTWIVFNPAGDLAELSGAELSEMRHEMALRDGLALVFADQAAVVPGARFVSRLDGGVETSDEGLHAVVHFAPERLTPQSTYASFRPFGSVRTVEVELDTVELTPPAPAGAGEGAGLSGRVVIDIEAGPDDVDEARTGQLEGTFTAPVVHERPAEHNLGLLGAADVIGLPLAPPTDEP